MVISLVFFSIIMTLVLVNFVSILNFNLYTKVYLDSFKQNDFFNKAYFEIFDRISEKIKTENPKFEDFNKYIADSKTKISFNGSGYEVTKIANSNKIMIYFQLNKTYEIFSIYCNNDSLKFCKLVRE